MEVKETLPYHVGIILDGNRRWAKERKRPTFFGHVAGIKRAIALVTHLRNRGVKIVTLYAFSTENWKRSQKEVAYLMRIYNLFMKKNMKDFSKQGGRLVLIGDRIALPDFLNKSIKEAEDATVNNKEFILQIALNYGGRDELVRAIKAIIKDKIGPELITEDFISKQLDTKGLPDPDLIIRTSGEQRLSNFLTWQGVYSELYFIKEHLPDFSDEKMDEVLSWYSNRDRRLGK